ncbi:MAG: amino acid permease [Acetobacter papayae]
MDHAPVPATDDAASLAALGVKSDFDRSMSMIENFALGFTYLSPVVGVYTLFDTSLQTGGGPMIWSYVLAGIGQFLVALIFGEVVAQFPISGGLYPWARRLVGRKWSWVTAWVYVWALFTTIAAVATGAAPFLALLTGGSSAPGLTTAIALALIALSTLCNLAGTKLLARVAMFGFICELVGALFVGGYLLAFHRVNTLGALLDPMNAAPANGSYLPAFLAASLLGLFSCYGFEACGDVAEEIPDPGRQIPKAMRMTIYIGVGASIFACAALLLAVPDIPAVISGTSPNALSDVLMNSFGPTGTKGVAAIVMVSFMSCVLSLQAAVSRLIYSFARDGMVAGSAPLSRVSTRHVPVNALYLSGLVPGAIVLLGLFAQDALTTIVSFAVVGIYVAFQMVVAGALYARLRGWQPGGPFTLGRWGFAVNIAALAYGVLAIINILWPRMPDAPWYINYSMWIGLALVVATALAYLALAQPHLRGSVRYADAWLISPRRR